MFFRSDALRGWFRELQARFRAGRLAFDLMFRDDEFFKFIWRFQALRQTAFWQTAERAVESVKCDRLLNEVSAVTDRTPFCPRCGQTTDGDRRMDEARELAAAKLWRVPVKRSELDFALAYWYLVKK